MTTDLKECSSYFARIVKKEVLAMQKKKESKREFKTGKDIFSRYNNLCCFVGGCLLGIPFTLAFKIIDVLRDLL